MPEWWLPFWEYQFAKVKIWVSFVSKDKCEKIEHKEPGRLSRGGNLGLLDQHHKTKRPCGNFWHTKNRKPRPAFPQQLPKEFRKKQQNEVRVQLLLRSEQPRSLTPELLPSPQPRKLPKANPGKFHYTSAKRRFFLFTRQQHCPGPPFKFFAQDICSIEPSLKINRPSPGRWEKHKAAFIGTWPARRIEKPITRMGLGPWYWKHVYWQ